MLLECDLNVVGGAADRVIVGAVAALLVDLRKGGLDKGGCGAKGGDHPHPEHGARAAERDGRSDTCDIADAHSRGGRNHQGPEGRDRPLLVWRFRDDADGLSEHAKGQGLGADKEVQARADEESDENVAVERRGDDVEVSVDDLGQRLGFRRHDVLLSEVGNLWP